MKNNADSAEVFLFLCVCVCLFVGDELWWRQARLDKLNERVRLCNRIGLVLLNEGNYSFLWIAEKSLTAAQLTRRMKIAGISYCKS